MRGISAKGVVVFVAHNASDLEYHNHLIQTLSIKPDVFIDGGGDLASLLEDEGIGWSDRLIGSCEETTAGIQRLYARVRQGKLSFPMYNI